MPRTIILLAFVTVVFAFTDIWSAINAPNYMPRPFMFILVVEWFLIFFVGGILEDLQDRKLRLAPKPE